MTRTFLAALASGLTLSGTAAAAPPGQRLVDYLSAQATKADRVALIGLSLEGGHATVVNGKAVARGVVAVVRTNLADSGRGSFVAQRLCAVASVGVKRLGLAQVGSVEVRARDGVARAWSFRLGLPVCHRVV